MVQLQKVIGKDLSREMNFHICSIHLQTYIATANNKVIKDFKYHITNLWEPSSRIERITELLQAKSKHSVEDYMNYQEDILSPYAKSIVPYILFAFQDAEVKDENLAQVTSAFA